MYRGESMTYFIAICKYWKELVILLLIFLVLGLVVILSHKDNQMMLIKQKYLSYVAEQSEQHLKAQLALQEKQKEYDNQIIIAEKNYNEKIKIILRDAHMAESYANSLSEQLASANKKLSTVDRQTETEYTYKLANVFQSCVTEYRKMAENADNATATLNRLSY